MPMRLGCQRIVVFWVIATVFIEMTVVVHGAVLVHVRIDIDCL